VTASLLGIRRYPVKAMTGESLSSVPVDPRGLAGDRWWAVTDADGRFASHKDSRRFRRRDGIEEFAATTGDDGSVEVSGQGGAWTPGDPGLDAALSARLGAPVRIASEAGVPHQDAASVSLVGTATLRWCADRWGVDADPRRLRVNLLVETDEPFVEESWVGGGLAVGDVVLRLDERAERCRTIDLAQDGLATSSRWLKALGQERGLCLAVYAGVVTPGTLTVGNAVVPLEPAP
jgi:uncharacterized protein YcbX